MTDLLRAVTDFLDSGGPAMLPLLVCSLVMWACLLRVWLELMPLSGRAGRRGLAETFARLRSGRGRDDARLAGSLSEVFRSRLRGRLSIAAVFAAAAPLLGLFGTITGMIDTFDGVARFGMANPKVVSSGISQAMISTQTGLIVAVPGVIVVYFLRRRVHRTRTGLEPFENGGAA